MYRVEICEDCQKIINHYPVTDALRMDYVSPKPMSKAQIQSAILNGLMTGSEPDNCSNCLPLELLKACVKLHPFDVPRPKCKHEVTE